jgi:hypothetical protein
VLQEKELGSVGWYRTGVVIRWMFGDGKGGARLGM